MSYSFGYGSLQLLARLFCAFGKGRFRHHHALGAMPEAGQRSSHRIIHNIRRGIVHTIKYSPQCSCAVGEPGGDLRPHSGGGYASRRVSWRDGDGGEANCRNF